MLKFRELNSTEKLEFKNNYDKYFNNLELDYLANSHVVGGFKKNIMCCGYVINTNNNNSRYLAAIPDKQERIKLTEMVDNDFCEITCLWIKPSRQSRLRNMLDHAHVYINMMIKAYTAGKKFILAGTINVQFKNFQHLVFNYSLWEGWNETKTYYTYINGVKRKSLMFNFATSFILGVLMKARLINLKNTSINLFKHISSKEPAIISKTTPVRTRPWPTYDKGIVDINEEDTLHLQEVINTKMLFRYNINKLDETYVGKFEKELCDYFNVKHALAVSSGTAAIAIGLMASKIEPGSYIACPGFTFPATSSAILLAGYKPFLIEVTKDLHFDLADLRNRFTPEIKAIVPVHMRGMASNIQEIMKFAQEKNLIVVEDAVASCGVKFNQQFLGTFGHVGAFSTQSDKSINTGEGGFILTNDDTIYERAIVFSGVYQKYVEKHIAGGLKYIDQYSLPLYNFRLSELQGAIAYSQIKSLPIRVNRQRAVYNQVIQKLSSNLWIEVRNPVVPDAILGEALIFKLPYYTSDDAFWFVQALNEEGIDCDTFCYAQFNIRCYWTWTYLFPNKIIDEIRQLLPNTNSFLEKTVDIPISSLLTDTDIDDLINAINKLTNYLSLNRDYLCKLNIVS